MTQPNPRMIPSSADAPTLTLAAATLLASVYPQSLTPEQQYEFGAQAVDAVFSLWDEIQARIASGVLVRPAE